MNQQLRLLLLPAALIGSFIVFLVPTAGAQIVPVGLTPTNVFNFESDVTQGGWLDVQGSDGDGCASIVTGTGQNGSNALRLHTLAGGNGVRRCDMTLVDYPNSVANGLMWYSGEQWWEHSVYIPSDFNSESSDYFHVVFDFHGDYLPVNGLVATQSNFEIEFRNNDIANGGLWISGHGGALSSNNLHPGKYPAPYGYHVGNWSTNTWYNFVEHVKWSAGNDGFMQVWLNGTKIIDYSGPTLYSSGGATVGTYMKLANYHPTKTRASSVIHDRVIRYDVGSPPPQPPPPPTPTTPTPYTGTPISIPGTFEAENYDKGGEGVAYHDTASANDGAVYRTSEGVDLRTKQDNLGGYEIYNFATGEWVGYTINVATAGLYNIEINASNAWSSSVAFHAEVDGINVSGSVLVPSTGSWSNYRWIGKNNIQLSAGRHILKVVSDTPWFGLDSIRVTAVPTATVPGAPAIGTATAGNAQATVSFSAPSSNGGSVITSYTVTSSPGGITASGASSPLTVTGLTNGTAYTFTVKATNSVGTGASSAASNAVTPVAPPPPSTFSVRLFASGFEGSTALSAPSRFSPTNAWQELEGTDTTTGYSWSDKIWGNRLKFQLLVNTVMDASTVNNYIINRIETVTGHDGNPTRAMYSELRTRGGGATQDPLMLEVVNEEGDMYISYWLKLQPDLYQKMDSWRAFFALKTSGDYRVEAYVAAWNDHQCTPTSGDLYWKVQGDNEANGGLPYQRFWREDNCSVPIPAGEWFKVEVFWHRSSGADGRVWMAINGQTIADHRGPNMGKGLSNSPAPINRIMMPLLYTGSAYPAFQWLDDLEVWSGFPPSGSPPPSPTPTTPTPYTGTPIAVPGTFEAENYDKGGEGVAYHDTASANDGAVYRTSEGVDLRTKQDNLGGYEIYNFATGEWVGYTINVATAGLYNIEINASNAWSSSVAFHAEVDGINVSGSVLVPSTGSWSNYRWIGKNNIQLSAGRHILKVVSDTPWFGLDAIRVTASPAPTTPIVGDFNNDGRVNFADLVFMITNWNKNSVTHDLNRDGVVNSLDYVVMVQRWTQ